MANPVISFRNYQFTEERDQLIVTKTAKQTERFSRLVQSHPCSTLLMRYNLYLFQKLLELKALSPKIHSPKARESFRTWQAAKEAKLQQKIVNPIAALQTKVARRCEQLFQEKGERSLLLGCGHLQEGKTLRQTQSDFFHAFPPSTDPKESHSHRKSVCIDWRADLHERKDFEIGENLRREPWYSFS